MKNMKITRKQATLASLGAVLAVAVIFTCAGCSSQETTGVNETSSPPKEAKTSTGAVAQSVSLSIDYGEKGEKTTYDTDFTEGDTVFSILEKTTTRNGLGVETSSGEYGLHIESINDVAETETELWFFSVNDEMSGKSADEIPVAAGDEIKFIYSAM